jgi:hypothetical protein
LFDLRSGCDLMRIGAMEVVIADYAGEDNVKKFRDIVDKYRKG